MPIPSAARYQPGARSLASGFLSATAVDTLATPSVPSARRDCIGAGVGARSGLGLSARRDSAAAAAPRRLLLFHPVVERRRLDDVGRLTHRRVPEAAELRTDHVVRAE